MKTQAIVVDGTSKNFSLSLGEIELPELNSGEVLIQVKAAGINRADLLQREGRYPVPEGASQTLGLEVSGIIEKVGSGVSDWKVGDEVFSLLAGGGYAKHAIAEAALLWRKPKDWSFAQAAALPEGIFAAFLNLVIEGELSVGERVLVQGGASGIGTFAVQIARRLGAHVVSTAGSDERCRKVKELGAHECYNYHTADFASIEPFDLIFDIVGGSNIELHVNLLAAEGRLVCVGTQGGATGQLNVRDLMRKRGRIIGSVLRPRTLEEKTQIKSKLDLVLGQALLSGDIRPIVDSIIPIAETERAHARMRAGEHFGKIVLSC